MTMFITCFQSFVYPTHIYNFYAASKGTDNDSEVISVGKPEEKKKILYTNAVEIILSSTKFIFEKVSISCW